MKGHGHLAAVDVSVCDTWVVGVHLKTILRQGLHQVLVEEQRGLDKSVLGHIYTDVK